MSLFLSRFYFKQVLVWSWKPFIDTTTTITKMKTGHTLKELEQEIEMKQQLQQQEATKTRRQTMEKIDREKPR